MAHHAALVSLKHTLWRFYKFSAPPYNETIKFADCVAVSVREVLKRLYGSNQRWMNASLNEIQYKLERMLEFSGESHELLSLLEGREDEDYSTVFSAKGVRGEIDSYMEEVEKIMVEYIKEFDNPLPEMAHHAALISLNQTLRGLHKSSGIWAPSEMIKFGDNQPVSVQEVFERILEGRSSSSERMNALDGEIREALYKLKDVIQSHMSDDLLSREGLLSLYLEQARQETDYYFGAYLEELDELSPVMAAHHAALISLDQILKQLRQCFRFCATPETTKVIYNELLSAQKILRRYDGGSCNSERINVVYEAIRKVVHKLRFALRSHMSDPDLLHHKPGLNEGLLSLQVEQGRRQIDSYMEELDKLSPEMAVHNAALISLNQTSQRLRKNVRFCAPPETTKFIYNELVSVQKILKRFDGRSGSSERMNVLYGSIREAVHKLQDVLQSFVSDQLLSQQKLRLQDEILSIHMEQARQQIDSYMEAVEKMVVEYIEGLEKPLPEMAAHHDALISLNQTLRHLHKSFGIRAPPETIKFIYNELVSIQGVLKRLDDESSSSSERMKGLDEGIREAAYKLEDVIESHMLDQLLQQSQSLGNEGRSPMLSIDVEEVRQEINSSSEALTKIKEVYMKELDDHHSFDLSDNEVDALISFRWTLKHLQNFSRILTPPETISFTCNDVVSLQELLKRLEGRSSSERMNALDGEIREAVKKLQDVLQSHVLDQLLSQSQSHGHEGCSPIHYIDLEEVRQQINSIMEAVEKMIVESIEELDNPLPEMAAHHTALISIYQTLRRLHKSSKIFSYKETIIFANNEVVCLQEILERLDGRSSRKTMNALDRQMREAVNKLEDEIESQLCDFSSPWLSQYHEEVQQQIDSFMEAVEKIMVEYIKELDNPLPEMAHHAALISLNQTLRCLQKSSGIWAPSETIKFICKEVVSLQESLKQLDGRSCSKKMNDLCGEIREAVYKLDVLQSHMSDQLLSQSESRGNEACSSILSIEDVEAVREQIDSFIVAVEKTMVEYIKELDNPLPEMAHHAALISLNQTLRRLHIPSRILEEEEKEEEGVVSSRIDSGGNKSNIVGYQKGGGGGGAVEEEEEGAVSSRIDFGGNKDVLSEIKKKIMWRTQFELGVVSLVGEAGSGTIVLAKTVFDDPRTCEYFRQRVWVTIGPKYQFKEIFRIILSQIDAHHVGNDHELLNSEGDEKILAEYLFKKLKGRRYLIALDNVCDTKVWDFLRRSFPEEYDGSRVLLTTSLEEVARFANSYNILPLSILNKEESWHLRQQMVFVENLCPPELEEAGKKIVGSCRGLPLEIAKVALFISKAEKTPDIWNKLVAQRENIVFKDAYDEMAEISRIIEDLQSSNSFIGGGGGDVFSRSDSAGRILDVLGFSHAIEKIISNFFIDEQTPKHDKVTVLYGMAGIGKTTLAKDIFEDPLISRHFDHRVWLTLGPTYHSEKILEDILAQTDCDKMHMKGDEILAKRFCTILSCKRCLIVLDDVWNEKPHGFTINLFEDIRFQFLLTTRLTAAAYCFTLHVQIHEMRLLNKEESWCLLREKAFEGKLCPPKLEKAGKMIAENCNGLPLMIITVGSLLSESEETPEFWYNAAKRESLVFNKANDKISKVLFPSYEYLHTDLKACFLYMGIFPQNYKINTSKLFKLWYYDGIFERVLFRHEEFSLMEHLDNLDSRSLLMIGKKHYMNSGIKTCSLHSVFWHLCIREARKSQFFHVLNRLADGSEEHIKGQRRLCIQNSILFGIKEVYNSMASNSTARSLLCTGRPHQYPVPICFGSRLLRVLEALPIRFYEFPIKVLDLVCLMYLAITYDGKIPPSISRLKNLECLIVRQHQRTKLYGTLMYMPKEIWDMQELKHLQVMGSSLPDPCGARLPNLKTLLDVCAHSCNQSVLEGVPNLKELGIQIELRPDVAEPFCCFDHISDLRKLQSLKCVVMNPEFMRSEILPPPPLSMSQSGLAQLSLNGLGYPWEYMTAIASLPKLKVLNLRCYVVRGPQWVVHKGEFQSLCYLRLEDTDLVYWRAEDGFNLSLRGLVIKHCYKLKKIPFECLVGNASVVELLDCNPSALEEIQDFVKELENAHVHSSWEC